jgi:hypothetical protein
MDGPDFLCVGAQKAGTGWLYEQLRAHPDFWMPPVKELHYFDRPRGPRERVSLWRLLLDRKAARRFWLARRRRRLRRKTARDARDLQFLDAMEPLYEQPEIDFDAYAALFQAKGPLISGDVTPAYSTLHDEIIDRITMRFPNLRVIFLARDPVERVWSQLSMRIRHQTIGSFNPNDVDSVARNLLRSEVLLRSYPSQIVARWRRYVSPERFRIYFFDDLKRDPAGLRESVIEFLGGDPRKASGSIAPEQNSKAAKEKLPLGDAARTYLAAFFEEELESSASNLGGPAAQWPARYDLK